MRNLFEMAKVEEVKQRLMLVRPESQRKWGKMYPVQMLAHCSAGLEMAMGRIRPRRLLVGWILGRAVKPVAFRDEEPLRRNVGTAKELLVGAESRDFAAERSRLIGLIDAFAAAGPEGCTTHPHCFFGRLTPEEWAALMYKHLDHHLRQFSA